MKKDVLSARRQLQKCFLPADSGRTESDLTIANRQLQWLEDHPNLTQSIIIRTKISTLLRRMQGISTIPAEFRERSSALLDKWNNVAERYIPRTNHSEQEQIEKDALYTRYKLQRCFPQANRGHTESNLTIANRQLQWLEDHPNLTQSIITTTKIATLLRRMQGLSTVPAEYRERSTALLDKWNSVAQPELPGANHQDHSHNGAGANVATTGQKGGKRGEQSEGVRDPWMPP